MNRYIVSFVILLTCLISDCVPVPEQYTPLETRVISVAGAQSVLIQVDYGEVTILESEDRKISVEGQVLFIEELEYLVVETEEQILIQVFAHRESFSRIPLKVIVRVPPPMQIKVETTNASVYARAYPGDLEVASVAGDITLDGVTGRMALQSNRGNITVRESSGTIGMVGNYGLLTAQDVHGITSTSTIIGNIEFYGLIEGDDTVHLESDHGSIFVNLDADSALTVQVHSTSGDVTCILPDIQSTTRTCIGELNSSNGQLTIRTVSGAVIVKLTP